ncbi:transglutaminase family protein [bacterium]|nr:transglutaminase family protein [bacterium]
MRYRVRHQTDYQYAEEVSLSQTLLTCQPRNTERQHCLSSETWIEPSPTFWERRRDSLGNWISYFSLEELHRRLTIVCRSLVEVRPASEPISSCGWEEVRLEDPSLHQFLYPTPSTTCDQCRDFAALSFQPGRDCLEALRELNTRIYKEFGYRPGSTDISTPIAQVLEHRSGVCQDFAHLMVCCARHFGLPARYVSGYLLTTPPPGQPRLVGADASHAWASIWLPGPGWVDFDPTNNCLCGEQHVVVAWGRDYQEVAPVRGVVLGGGRQSIQVAVDVTPE